MPEPNEKPVYQEQKKIRPDIEIVFNDFLDDDIRKNALRFIAWLKENKTAPRWASTNSWNVKYKRNDRHGSLCSIKAEKGYWNILFNRSLVEEYDVISYSSSDALSENTWYGKMDYVKHCPGGRCHNNCAAGRKKVICGNDYNDICWHMPVIFHNPDVAVLECVKKLIEFRKKLISESLK